MKLIIGLGNPGPQYETTRHNAGFLVLDLIGDSIGCGNISTKFGKSLIATGRYRGEKLILAKPQCYMNRSGLAVAELAAAYGRCPEEIIIIHDDVDLDLGRLRIRASGGHGGHKGVLSVLNELGANNFCRVKIGVGRPPEGMDTPDYVLSVFDDSEWNVFKRVLPVARDAVLTLVVQGVQEAMNRYNGTTVTVPPGSNSAKLE
ncbi:MAG: aminoacyl-tRNA hydrolase [Bacillota bacterium]|jgi:PTH1 family peptidyl-tRNA hydrolase